MRSIFLKIMHRTIGFSFIFFFHVIIAFPDPGQWSASYADVPFAIFGIHKPLYAGSSIHVTVNCEPHTPHQSVTLRLQWVLRQTSCFEDYLASDIFNPQVLNQYLVCPMSTNYLPKIRFFVSDPINVECSNRIHLQFVNATFVTFSEKTPITPECESSINILTSATDSTGDNHNLPNGTSLELKLPAHEVNSEVSSTRNARTASSQLGNETAEQPVNNSEKMQANDSPLAHIPRSTKVPAEKLKNEKLDVNYARIHNNNETFPNTSTYGYVSGPMSPSSTVKLGSKLATVDMDGIYLFILKVKSLKNDHFNVSVDVAMKGEHGYLSAVDYPLLLFYGVMCGLYVVYAFAWLVVSAMQWRDLLRIQFWIGGVILLGLMEKAVFYAEYQSINSTGQSVQGAVLFAEILSCMKRTLARMLVIIVSLGFGIVKPRLGAMLHRVVGVGVLYFILGTVEGILRVFKPKTDPGNQALMAGIPLAVTDSAICWWIFSSLVQTIRTLRLRRNIVKLALYLHFTNTILFAVLASVAFMIWSIHSHKLVNCITDWKELWVDEAYWHLLFSLILLVIMILWRPTINNQRYAFTPLLDAVDDDDEDDDDDNHVTNDAFAGMKMRSQKNSSSSIKEEEETKNKQDEDLRWVEENIPTSLSEAALPSLLDSDEEIMTAKFERSKME